MIISDEEYIKFIKDGQKFALEIMRRKKMSNLWEETIEFLENMVKH